MTLFFASAAAFAQTPGVGETRPTVPGGAIQGGTIKEREPTEPATAPPPQNPR